MKLPTVEIINPRNHAFLMRINQIDFDPVKHQLWNVKTEAAADNAIQEETKTKAGKVYSESELDELHWTQLRELLEELGLGTYQGKDDAIAKILASQE